MNSEDLTLKQVFDVTAQLVNDQEEIHGLDKIHWGKNSWRRLSLIGDETVINLQRTKVHVFSGSVLCLGRVLQHPESNEAWKNRVWSFIEPGSEEKWHSAEENSPRRAWDDIADEMLLELAESGHPCQSAVFTEHLRTLVRNSKPIKIDLGNLMY